MDTTKRSNGASIAVAVIGTGEMGSAVAKRLLDSGARVKTSVVGRSEVSRKRIEALGIPIAASDEALVEDVDIILSIVPPGEAVAVAKHFASILKKNPGKHPIFIDGNAVSPQTAAKTAEIFSAAGVDFVDGGIIGTPPRAGYDGPAIYVSGPRANDALRLRDVGLPMRLAGDAIGDASALKLSYAGITKGFTAVVTTMFIAAQRAGVRDKLADVVEETLPGLWMTMSAGVPRAAPKAYRWVAEMLEISEYVTPDGIGNDVYKEVSKLYERVAARLDADGEGPGTQLGELKSTFTARAAKK